MLLMGNLLHNRDVLVLFVCSWVICTLNGTLHAEPPHPPSSSQLTIDRLTQAHSLELEDIHSSELVGIHADSIQAARVALHRVVLELAQKTTSSKDIQSSIELSTLRLSISIPWLDEYLRSFCLPDTQVGIPPRSLSSTERDEALEAINEFSNNALEIIRRSPMSSFAEMDLALNTAFRPLLKIIRITEPNTEISHWPTVAQVLHSRGQNQDSAKPPVNTTDSESDTSHSIVILREFSRPVERRLDSYADDSAADEKAIQDAGDLERIEKAERWLEIIKTSSPSSYMGVLRQLKPLFRMLSNEDARANGVIAIDGILNQYESYYAMPLDDQLLTPSSKLSTILAGRGPEIHRQLSVLRIKWLDEFSRGRAQGDSAEHLARIRRLLTITQDILPLSLQREQIRTSLTTLNTWAAWHLPPETVEWMIRSLIPRLKLASTAIAEGEFDNVDIECDRLERVVPFAILVSLLNQQLSPALQRDTTGPPGMIVSLAIPPKSDAWMVDQRELLANLCLTAITSVNPQVRGDEKRTRELHMYLQRSSTYLIDVIKRMTQ